MREEKRYKYAKIKDLRMFHFVFHFVFHFGCVSLFETQRISVSVFLRLICFCFTFDFCGVSVLKQIVKCYYTRYYIGKITKKFMFHFFSSNQKQTKINEKYITVATI